MFYLLSIPSSTLLTTEHLILIGGHLSGNNNHALLPSRPFVCANHGPGGVSFSLRREGLPLLPEQLSGLAMKEITQQHNSCLGAGVSKSGPS